MSDINFLSQQDGSRNDRDGGAPKPASDDLTMHVPAVEPPLVPVTLSQARPTAPPTPPQPPIIPAPVAPPIERKVAKPIPPPPPPPPAPPKPPAFQKPLESPSQGAGTLRVSLLTTTGGTSLSALKVRARLRTIMIVAFFAILLDAGIYGALVYYKSRIASMNSELEGRVAALNATIAETEQRVTAPRDFQALADTAGRVLDAHAHWTRVLAFFEEKALAQVQFANLAGAETGNLSTEMLARDYTTLAKQIVAFRNDPRVKSVTVGAAAASYGDNGLLQGVTANMSLVLHPQVFLYDKEQASE